MGFVHVCAQEVAELSSSVVDVLVENGLPYRRDERLPKEERLKKRKEILEVFTKGKTISGNHMVIHYLTVKPDRKAGFAVSKKVKRKVDRNRIKRRLREIYRREKWRLKNVHLMVLGTEGVLHEDFRTLYHELVDLLNKIAADEGDSTAVH